MESGGDKLNSFENCDNLWPNYSDYNKALYLTNNPSDCCFVLTTKTEYPKKFYAHKWILICASSKFECVFNDNLKEIPLTDVEPQVFQKFLDFVYYGDIENLRCADVAALKNLIDLSKKYEIVSLKDNCIKMMKENLDKTENYDLIGIFEYACLKEDSELINECKRIIVGRANSKLKFPDCNLNRPTEEKRDMLQVKKDLNALTINTETSSTNLTESDNVRSSSGLNIFGAASNVASNFPQAQQGATAEANASTGFKSFSSFGQSVVVTAKATGTAGKVVFASPSCFAQVDQSKNNRSEEKIQNTEKNVKKKPNMNIFGNSFMPVGLSKGDITKCSYIYQLDPAIFYEFQNTLSGYIPEIARFDLIETYAKINGLISDRKDDKDSSKSNNMDSLEPPNKAENKQRSSASANHLLNMMLRSIKFHRMSAKEFAAGPGKSTLLDTAEKYDILVNIVNIN